MSVRGHAYVQFDVYTLIYELIDKMYSLYVYENYFILTKVNVNWLRNNQSYFAGYWDENRFLLCFILRRLYVV